MQSLPVHPLRQWRVLNGLTCDDVGSLAGFCGRLTNGRYIRQIEKCRRWPSYGLAAALSAATGGIVPTYLLLTFGRQSR